MIKYYLLSFLILSSIYVETTKACAFVQKSYVYVRNNLPSSPPLRYHCASKNDDFGFKDLSINQEFSFAFCPKPYFTLYFCRFWWKGKDKSFDVFNANVFYSSNCTAKRCYYSVRADGFYIAYEYPPKQFTKVADW